MGKNLMVIRFFFFLLALAAGALICYVTPEWEQNWIQGSFVGGSIAFFVIAVDIFLKGFSMRGLTSLTLGLFVGWLAAKLIVGSPLFEYGDEGILYLMRMSLFLILMYLGAVIALRGKDDFHFVIPFVRFEQQDNAVLLAVVDTSVLIDGRIVGLCSTKFMVYTLVIPQFVLDELHRVADSDDPNRKAKGRKGLETLSLLKAMKFLDIRIHDTDIKQGQTVDDKLIFLSQSLKARLLTTDYNLGKLAEFQGVEWLNLNELARLLHTDVAVGEVIEIALVKTGKEDGQAVGFMGDGSMVVVEKGRAHIGQVVSIEVTSVLPSAGGRIVFGVVKEEA